MVVATAGEKLIEEESAGEEDAERGSCADSGMSSHMTMPTMPTVPTNFVPAWLTLAVSAYLPSQQCDFASWPSQVQATQPKRSQKDN